MIDLKQFFQKLKNNWVRAWMITAIIASGTFVVVAAYTEVSSVKRVVSTQKAPGEPFSSNCMNTLLASRRMGTTQFPVTVCNFAQDYPKNWSSSEIQYVLTAEFKVKIGNDYKSISDLAQMVTDGEMEEGVYNGYVAQAAKTDYSITKTEGDGSADEFDNESNSVLPIQKHFTEDEYGNYTAVFGGEVLKEGGASTDLYTVTIPEDDCNSEDPKYFIYVTATPVGALQPISARLYGALIQQKEAEKWDGYIADTDLDTKSYDFWNYVITGTGIGTVDIVWNPDQISINKYFLIENGLEEPENRIAADNPLYGASGTKGSYTGCKVVTLPVDSVNKTNRYELQIYKSTERSTLIDPSGHIHCFFTQAD